VTTYQIANEKKKAKVFLQQAYSLIQLKEKLQMFRFFTLTLTDLCCTFSSFSPSSSSSSSAIAHF